MNQQQIEKLQELGGKLWEKNGYKRVYFNADQILEQQGVDIGYYNTGNVSSATLDGERISNSEAKRILANVNSVYYDLVTDKWAYKPAFDKRYNVYMTNFISHIQKQIEVQPA